MTLICLITKENFVSGLVSGLVLSFCIWGYQFLIRRIRSIRIVFDKIDENKIGVVNLSLWRISNIEIKGLLTYNRNGLTFRHNILIDNEKSYMTTESLKGVRFNNYIGFHLLRKDITSLENLKPRYFDLDFSPVIIKPPITIEKFNDLEQKLNDIHDSNLCFFVHYYGRLSTVLKIRKETYLPLNPH